MADLSTQKIKPPFTHEELLGLDDRQLLLRVAGAIMDLQETVNSHTEFLDGIQKRDEAFLNKLDGAKLAGWAVIVIVMTLAGLFGAFATIRDSVAAVLLHK